MSRYCLDPVRISKSAWYYETKHGLNLVMEVRDSASQLVKTTMTIIPWRKIEVSLRHHKKASKP